jgi:hypothetical protein
MANEIGNMFTMRFCLPGTTERNIAFSTRTVTFRGQGQGPSRLSGTSFLKEAADQSADTIAVSHDEVKALWR